MIHDHYGARVDLRADPAVDVLYESPFSFYLTGSHFFGCERKDSDIDFMVQKSQEVETWLKDHGFTKNVLEYAPRVGMLTYKVLQRDNVQVQLCNDLALKRRVRDFIAVNNAEWHRTADRDQRMWMWDTVATVFDPVRYCPEELFTF